MTCRYCGHSLTASQRAYCSKTCAGKGIGSRPQSSGGKMQDAAWLSHRGQLAGRASGKAAKQRHRERVRGMTPQEAWLNGYRTCRQQMRRHYESWMRQELVKREQQRAQMARTEPAA